MRCEDCRGDGIVLNPALRIRVGQGQRILLNFPGPPGQQENLLPILVPCPGCGGSGITSCCEGMCGNASDVTNDGPR